MPKQFTTTSYSLLEIFSRILIISNEIFNLMSTEVPDIVVQHKLRIYT